MQNNDWAQVGENIKECVMNAIDSRDFSGLSKTIEDSVNGAIDQLNNKLNGGSRSFGFNQMKSSAYNTQTKRYSSGNGKAASSGRQVTQQTAQLPTLYAKNPPGTYSGPALKVLGIIGSSLFGLATFILTLLALIFSNGVLWFIDAFVGFLLGGSIVMLRHGVKTAGVVARFKQYVSRIGDSQFCELEQLANMVGKKKSFVEKDIRKMIEKGFFLQGHIDDQGTTLITSNTMYQKYLEAENSRKTREIEMKQRAKEVEQITITEVPDGEYPENVRAILNEGAKYVQHIRECNEAIPGEVMSQKLATLEDIMKRIFEQLKKNPESADDLQKLMKYYLPTTTKLIDAYKDLEGQPSFGDNNIANTKKEIEDTIDVINAAFGKLFDDMFQDAAWDISTDISTMKTMLAKEGLTGESDFKVN